MPPNGGAKIEGQQLNTSRAVTLVSADSIPDDVPVWAWSYGDKGRIQLGTLALFAGRPGAGKSTAARWLAAGYSNGTIAGCWEGKPQSVAYIAPAEESVKYIVKPGLRAAGADLARIHFPEVRTGTEQVALMSITDEKELTAQLVASGITVVIVDPLMDTIAAGVDINRNNEVRSVVQPWSRMADQIGGIVVGVAHLKKASGGDVVAGINASSAFGEVARAVFGFAKDPESDGDRIMSQAKNSTGEEDLALVYRIESHTVTTDSGKSADVGRFVITGNSDRTVGDVLSDNDQGDNVTQVQEAQTWLSDYLTEHAPVKSKTVKDDGRKAGFNESSVKRAFKKLGGAAVSQDFPRVTYWSLPQSAQQSGQGSKGDPTDPTAPTDPTVTVSPVNPVGSVRSLRGESEPTAEETARCPCGAELYLDESIKNGQCMECWHSGRNAPETQGKCA